MDIPNGFVPTELGATAWSCEAYGEDGKRVGAHCFVGDAHGLRCERKEVCGLYMANERQRLWRIIHAPENNEKPEFVYLRNAFKSANELLRADDVPSRRHTWIQPKD